MLPSVASPKTEIRGPKEIRNPRPGARRRAHLPIDIGAQYLDFFPHLVLRLLQPI
jgi:hypothetical protein